MTEKKVDESWKEKVGQETQKITTDDIADKAQEKTDEAAFEMPPVDFNLFISSLGMQALMALGEIENPMSGQKETQLPQGKYLIDTLEMLQVKTKGNLEAAEANMIETMLYELRMKYVALSNEK